jgi:hypothetical protein
MKRGRLLAYAPWQMRDFLIERGLPILLVGAFVGGQILLISSGRIPVGNEDQALEMVVEVFRMLALPFVLIAAAGLVSNDRKGGYFRFLFAKPVTPWVYYLQALLINGIGLMAVTGILLFLFQMFFHPVNPVPVLLQVGLLYLSTGGIILFVSSITRLDWIIVAALWGGAGLVGGAWSRFSDWRGLVARLLPPSYVYDRVSATLGHGSAVAATDVLWIIGYSGVFLALAVLVLRRRSFAD